MEKPKRLKYSDLHDMYNADDMDTYLAQKEKEISALVGALEFIYNKDSHKKCYDAEDVKYIFASRYHDFREKAASALNKHKTINE